MTTYFRLLGAAAAITRRTRTANRWDGEVGEMRNVTANVRCEADQSRRHDGGGAMGVLTRAVEQLPDE